MTYDYQCPKCKKIIEVEHSMKEVGNPSPETLKKISCPSFGGCEKNNKKKILIFERVYITSPTIGGWESKTPQQKQQVLAKRSQNEAKKNSDRKEHLSGKAMKEMRDLAKGKI